MLISMLKSSKRVEVDDKRRMEMEIRKAPNDPVLYLYILATPSRSNTSIAVWTSSVNLTESKQMALVVKLKYYLPTVQYGKLLLSCEANSNKHSKQEWIRIKMGYINHDSGSLLQQLSCYVRSKLNSLESWRSFTFEANGEFNVNKRKRNVRILLRRWLRKLIHTIHKYEVDQAV